MASDGSWQVVTVVWWWRVAHGNGDCTLPAITCLSSAASPRWPKSINVWLNKKEWGNGFHLPQQYLLWSFPHFSFTFWLFYFLNFLPFYFRIFLLFSCLTFLLASTLSMSVTHTQFLRVPYARMLSFIAICLSLTTPAHSLQLLLLHLSHPPFLILLPITLCGPLLYAKGLNEKEYLQNAREPVDAFDFRWN